MMKQTENVKVPLCCFVASNPARLSVDDSWERILDLLYLKHDDDIEHTTLLPGCALHTLGSWR